MNYEAIATFVSTGFFLGSDTYFREWEVLQPGHRYTLDDNGYVLTSTPYFQWYYEPKDRSFKETVEEFAHLFESIVADQSQGKRVILPLSGGLDSRTQAVALRECRESVMSYSYEFRNGIPETRIAGFVAKRSGYPFKRFVVEPGYLWNCIEALARINRCFSEFTHPRQMAFLDQYAQMGDVFSLGHWGDVLFDNMKMPDNLSLADQTRVILAKVLKPGGLELGRALWKAWGLNGDFDEYLFGRVHDLMKAIKIDNPNARVRAFKSLHWAPRWTSVNLQVFHAVRPVTLPYYDERMCRFVCTVSEEWLSGRKIQLEYIKWKAPDLAGIPWQSHMPFNLYTYGWNRSPWNIPIRAWKKLAYKGRELISGDKTVLRNWELQFLGTENDRSLKQWLFENRKFRDMIPESVVRNIYDKFKTENARHYSHPLSMLLTLSLFSHLEKSVCV